MLLSKSHLSSTSYFSEQGREQKVKRLFLKQKKKKEKKLKEARWFDMRRG